MNFKKVELYGFKSFADKTEIKFGDGITGIVGPNGCGKSNVADAIRWVLGEQSAKNLRGSSMTDVIFNGTQGRKSLSYCEVSLYFDNTDKMFSLDYDEVIITRKLFRSGESEYYINREIARLKDIVALLHECGIGKEGYTIIGQGKVAEIMNSKPEDRRAIFEEATGISKFKTTKNESERKLDRTHENLVRLSDIISEVENQLAPLERQSEKAKTYNAITEELKHHEINTYIAKVDGVETAKAKINVKIKGLDEEAALRNKESEDANNEYEEIFSAIGEADERMKKLNSELLEKRVGMERSSGVKKLYEERISYLEGQIKNAENEIEKHKNLIGEYKDRITETETSIRNENEKLNLLTSNYDDADLRFISVSEKIALGEELATANQKKVIESLESLTDLKVNKGTMSITKANLLQKLDELNSTLNKFSLKREQAFSDKERADKAINDLDRAIFDVKNRINAKENEIRNGNEEAAEYENKIYLINSEVTALITKGNFYRENKENYSGYNQSVKNLLFAAKSNAELKKRVKGVVAEIIKSDKKFDVALETALAAAAQNIVTKDPDDAKLLMQYLKTHDMGRATFLPITSVKPRERHPLVTAALKDKGAIGVADEIVSFDNEYYNVISNLLGNTLIVDTLENANEIAKKYKFAFKVVTLEGDVFSTQGSMTGGSMKKDRVGLLSYDRKIEDNDRELAEKKKEMAGYTEKKKAVEEKRDKALDQLAILNEEYNSMHGRISVEREKQAGAENILSDLEKEIESTNELIVEVNRRIVKVDEEYEAVQSGNKKLEEEKESASSIADKNQAEYEELKKKRDELSATRTDLQVKITESRALIAALTEEKARLDSAVAESKSTIDRLLKSNDGAREIIENIRLDQEKVALTKEEQDYVNGLRSDIDGIEKYKDELKRKLAENAEKRQSLTDALTDIAQKRTTEEVALAKIDSDLEHLQQSVWEDYQETYETAQKFREDGYDEKFGEKEIARLRAKRNSLGAINATAIDDFKILKERYDDLLMQKDDMQKAEDDLRSGINKLKSEMLTQFDEGFNKINENFQKIFKELFGGGKAMLQLDYANSEDKLEAGVEIIVEPPGKKLQKLSLYSGGEQALTAIAILFSILKMRPMPFCVLDEIEAALDEANVDRFASYLHNFSKETQFIVITHRKPTMELADALFGVTMQEKGISKMVSVKLSDVATFNELNQN